MNRRSSTRLEPTCARGFQRGANPLPLPGRPADAARMGKPRTHFRSSLVLLALVACKKDGGIDTDTDTTADELGPLRSCEVTLRYDPPAGTKVQVAGRFNDWQPQDLADDDGDGVYERWLGELQPGTYGHKFVIDDVWETTPPDVYTTWDDGFENRALVVGDCDLPELEAVSSRVDGGTAEATFRFTRAADGAPLDESTILATVGDELGQVAVDAATGEIVVWHDDLGEGKHSIRLHVWDEEGREPESGMGFVPLWVEPEPFQWQAGFLYYAFLDRFADGGDDGLGPISGAQYGTDYLGGDLVGATQQLEAGWFDDLGVTSIWLSPVNQNPDEAFVGADGVTMYTGYHGYWPTEARGVEDRLGTSSVSGDEALKTFVDAAHERGIRVVVDVVLNHVHEDHEYLTSHADWFGAAPCPCTTDWGECNWDTNPIGCWFTDYLPDLDYKQQAVVDQIVDDLLWWAETYDVDGFRVDAAKHMDHVIMRTIRLKLQERYEDAGGAHFYTVGETFTGQGGQGLIMDYVAPYELDGQFDFPLLYPIRDIGKGYGFRNLSSETKASDAAYGDSVHWMSVFMGNHDVSRYATDIAGCDTWALFDGCRDVLADGSTSSMTEAEWDLVNKLSLSFAFVATQPGVPLLYYGDEIGLAGAGDPDNRRLMDWRRSQAQDTLLARFQQLGQLRTQVPALQTGERLELWVDDSLFVYARDNGGGDVAVIALATSARSQVVPVPTGLSLEGKTLGNALADTRAYAVSGGEMTVQLDAWEYVVLLPE